jgi:hypothetical protein
MGLLNSGRGRKAQVSTEFMMIFIFFIAVLSVSMVYMMQNIESTSASTLGIETGKTISLVKSKLETAFLEGDGFSTTFTLPQRIMGLDYSVNISSGARAASSRSWAGWRARPCLYRTRW